jgi:uncharacterized protein involved in response to NO
MVVVFVASALRLAATVHGLGSWAVGLAAILWALAFAVYWRCFAAILVTPSLPRKA